MSAFIRNDRVCPELGPAGSVADRPGNHFTRRMLCVFKAWLKNPGQVATVIPSSDYLIERMANRECVRNATTLVELGPGAGGTTEGLLTQMRPDARLLAIEKTTEFFEVLNELRDPRLIVEIADALELPALLEQKQLGGVDVIVSGIPFSSIPPSIATQIMQSIYQSLQRGGTLIAYQFHDDIDAYACPLFGPGTKERVPWNLPPLTVSTWTKT